VIPCNKKRLKNTALKVKMSVHCEECNLISFISQIQNILYKMTFFNIQALLLIVQILEFINSKLRKKYANICFFIVVHSKTRSKFMVRDDTECVADLN